MPRWRLDYRGPDCGGCNLPFESLAAARDYATERYATTFTVLRFKTFHVVLEGARQDCRYRWQVRRVR